MSLDPLPTDRHRPRVGSLCTGYGGLDLAVEAVLGGRLVWYAETDPHARTVLAHRFPGAANLGDIRTINWAAIAEAAPVDVLTAGFPCQDYPEQSVILFAGRRMRVARVGVGPGHSPGWDLVTVS